MEATPVYRFYRRTLGALLLKPGRAGLFLWGMGLAFVLSSLLAVTRAVPLKLLPFDNKHELQLVIDMPRSATLEETDAVARALGDYLARVNEVTDFETFVGIASPMDFNGMVRHYYLRRGGYIADIRVNLLRKEHRQQQSHEIALRIRPDVEGIAKAFGAKVKIVETPPGLPVLSTFVAEVYGPLDAEPSELARITERVRDEISGIPGVVDVDDFVDEPKGLVRYRVDRDKAALHGLSVAALADVVQTAVAGRAVGTVHVAAEREPFDLILRLKRADRSSLADLMTLAARSFTGDLVTLGELGTLAEQGVDLTLYHKNLQRLNYVTAEMAGRSPVEAVFDYWDREKARPLLPGYHVELAGEGEWKITVDVFRDLGLAFAAALVMIYVLLVAQTESFGMPLVIMVAIPLTIIGIMPGFWLLNLLFTAPIAGFANPILFTATGMIGMIALAGIVVRNSIILFDFIERLRERGTPLFEALVEAGATRLRPIFLTAGAAMFGSFVITLDLSFSGLAWSFIFGIFASTLFTLWVVPVVYWMIHRKSEQ